MLVLVNEVNIDNEQLRSVRAKRGDLMACK